MSGPKHLWSGNWQEESEAASERRADVRRRPEDDEPTRPLPGPEPERRKRPALPIVVVAVLFLAAVAFGLAAVLGSGSKTGTTGTQALAPNPGSINPGSTNPGRLPTPTVPSPAPNPSSPPATPTPTTPPTQSRPISWLGMEIETLPPGAAVIETVALGSAGDKAGLNPGDVIIAING